MTRYCSVCRCNRWHTPEGDCVVCIGLFDDAIRAASDSADKEQS